MSQLQDFGPRRGTGDLPSDAERRAKAASAGRLRRGRGREELPVATDATGVQRAERALCVGRVRLHLAARSDKADARAGRAAGRGPLPHLLPTRGAHSQCSDRWRGCRLGVEVVADPPPKPSRTGEAARPTWHHGAGTHHPGNRARGGRDRQAGSSATGSGGKQISGFLLCGVATRDHRRKREQQGAERCQQC